MRVAVVGAGWKREVMILWGFGDDIVRHVSPWIAALPLCFLLYAELNFRANMVDMNLKLGPENAQNIPRVQRERPVLRLTIRGPAVKRGRIAVPDLIRICQEAQAAVKRQAEALEGRKTVHPGPVSGPIQVECTLELIAIGKGSTKLDFAFAKPQARFPAVQAVGTAALSELAMSIKSLGNGNKRNIDPGVLESVYRLGSVAESGGISGLVWSIPAAHGRPAILAPLNALVRERAAQRLSAPSSRPATVDGVLDMADFKPEERKCRIDPPTSAPILCTFGPDLDDKVQRLLRQTVRGTGIGRYAANTQKIEVIQLKELNPLPSLELAGGNFYTGASLLELAEMQKVKPLRNPSLPGTSDRTAQSYN
jgi:hypothetical protein